jgi:hypothetical protein
MNKQPPVVPATTATFLYFTSLPVIIQTKIENP